MDSKMCTGKIFLRDNAACSTYNHQQPLIAAESPKPQKYESDMMLGVIVGSFTMFLVFIVGISVSLWLQDDYTAIGLVWTALKNLLRIFRIRCKLLEEDPIRPVFIHTIDTSANDGNNANGVVTMVSATKTVVNETETVFNDVSSTDEISVGHGRSLHKITNNHNHQYGVNGGSNNINNNNNSNQYNNNVDKGYAFRAPPNNPMPMDSRSYMNMNMNMSTPPRVQATGGMVPSRIQLHTISPPPRVHMHMAPPPPPPRVQMHPTTPRAHINNVRSSNINQPTKSSRTRQFKSKIPTRIRKRITYPSGIYIDPLNGGDYRHTDY